MGRHTLGSCLPITLGVTLEQQLREVKAGNSLAWLYSQGAGLVGQLWLATGLVQGMWSGHLLLTSSISAGGCDMWGLLVASTGLAGLVLALREVQLWYRDFSNAVPAWFGCRRRGRLANCLPWEKRRWTEFFDGATSWEPAGLGGGTSSSLFG